MRLHTPQVEDEPWLALGVCVALWGGRVGFPDKPDQSRFLGIPIWFVSEVVINRY